MYRALLAALLALLVATHFAGGQKLGGTADSENERSVLSDAEWEKVDQAIERALSWLAAQQNRDGSFPTAVQGQPAITSFCVLAFAAQGHLPGEGPYGDQLDKAVKFIVAAQKPNGLVSFVAPRTIPLARFSGPNDMVYNHGISSLALAELYGMTGGGGATDTRQTIEKALEATLTMQRWAKRRAVDRGGWRYVHVHNMDDEPTDSDLSVSGWQLMFLRSAKNAGFEVPKEAIDDAVLYVKNCFRTRYNTFSMMASDVDHRSRGMAGAGVLAFAHAGYHNTPEAQSAAEWILQHDFSQYNVNELFTDSRWRDDRYHYSVFLCSQAMYQLGGKYWERFFPPTAATLLANQGPDGSWASESHTTDRVYGNAYTTSLVVLALSAPNQLLPIFQR